MTCRHGPYDPACSSYGTSTTPDSSNYEVLDVRECSNNLVLKVKYPNCSKCEYEGTKIMVFAKVNMVDAFKWKKIDPHFRNSHPSSKTEAPSPVARFPANDKGWQDAIEYAKGIK
jgi:hypothetical protein